MDEREEKSLFRIGEVSRLVGVQPYVLRYWEAEFPGLAPNKSGAGHRFYRRKDVELLLRIKHLLYEKRFTIEGARQSLLDSRGPKQRKPKQTQQDLFAVDPLPEIRRELTDILRMLK